MNADGNDDHSNSKEFANVLSAQHNAFGIIFGMFKEMKESNADLEERLTIVSLERAKDALKIMELQEEVKVRIKGRMVSQEMKGLKELNGAATTHLHVANC